MPSPPGTGLARCTSAAGFRTRIVSLRARIRRCRRCPRKRSGKPWSHPTRPDRCRAGRPSWTRIGFGRVGRIRRRPTRRRRIRNPWAQTKCRAPSIRGSASSSRTRSSRGRTRRRRRRRCTRWGRRRAHPRARRCHTRGRSVGDVHCVSPGSHSPEQASPQASSGVDGVALVSALAPVLSGGTMLGMSSPSELVGDVPEPPTPSSMGPGSAGVSPAAISLVSLAGAKSRFFPAHPLATTTTDASARTAHVRVRIPRGFSPSNPWLTHDFRSPRTNTFAKPHILSRAEAARR